MNATDSSIHQFTDAPAKPTPGRSPSRFPAYEAHRRMMKTGDVILFSGKGFASDVIKWVTKSPYSHVGMVINEYLPGFGWTVLLIESTSISDMPDCVDRKVHKGVQMHFLSKVLDAYDGDVFWSPLKAPLEEDRKQAMLEWLRQAEAQHIGYDMAQCFGAGLDFLDRLGIKNHNDASKLFCSELVCKALEIGGAITGYNASEMTPADVAKLHCLLGGPGAAVKISGSDG